MPAANKRNVNFFTERVSKQRKPATMRNNKNENNNSECGKYERKNMVFLENQQTKKNRKQSAPVKIIVLISFRSFIYEYNVFTHSLFK